MNLQDKPRRLPRGIQFFAHIRREGMVYVDKTDMVYRLANSQQNIFLSRPRRFGKSLLTSTLHAYYEGKRELFEGLKIMELEHEWPQRQVFHFDFSGITTADALNSYLNTQITTYETQYGRSEHDESLRDRFLGLLKRAHERTGHRVAVLVDEYDAPLHEGLFDNTKREEMANVYRAFFPAMKTGEMHVKCLFLTGIMKFTQLSLFSVLNNVSIVGTWPEYATLCGITQQELLDNFEPELQKMATACGWTIDETLEKLAQKYDGYRFSRDLDKAVYNPYSLISALDDSFTANYWAASGSTRLIADVLAHNPDVDDSFEDVEMKADVLHLADASGDNVPLFLYQTGYLTIQSYNAKTQIYKLTIPNTEVHDSLFEVVIPNALQSSPGEVANACKMITKELEARRVDRAMELLKIVVSQTPYSRLRNTDWLLEERFRFIVANVLHLCGCEVEQEVEVASGAVDVVARYSELTMVIELKLDSQGGVTAARKQLNDHDYAAAFALPGRKVYTVAIGFARATRGISDIDVEAY